MPQTSQVGDASCSQVSLLIWIFKHSWASFIPPLSVFTRSDDSFDMTGVSNVPPDTPHTRRSLTNCFFLCSPQLKLDLVVVVLHKQASDFSHCNVAMTGQVIVITLLCFTYYVQPRILSENSKMEVWARGPASLVNHHTESFCTGMILN